MAVAAPGPLPDLTPHVPLQPSQLPQGSLGEPGILLPQDLCTCYSFCQVLSTLGPQACFPPHFQVFVYMFPFSARLSRAPSS